MDCKKTDLTFREAHKKTGEIVLLAEKKKKLLQELSIEEFKSIEPKINKDIYNFISIESSIDKKKSYGGTGFSEIKSNKESKKEDIDESNFKFNYYINSFFYAFLWKKIKTREIA